ncbi:hypothetical protein HDV00_003623 [Rhizophlyctis rosea]|nr:hypothetical protein HDV00_003623 [Rhizophlyctis rosea]
MSYQNPQSLQTLYVILPFSNPASFRRRQELLTQTLLHLDDARFHLLRQKGPQRLEVIVSELSYTPNAKPSHSNNNPLDLHLTTTPQNILWSKENLINLAIANIRRKVPTAKYFAWIDADIAFTSSTWVQDTLQALSTTRYPFLQLFQSATLLDPHNKPYQTVKSFAYQNSVLGPQAYKSRDNKDEEYWHPGFAWATTADVLDAVGGLVERTLGSADRHMAMCIIGKGDVTVPDGLHPSYKAMILAWQNRATALPITLSYIPGTISHSWHGDLRKRGYMERWDVLRKWNVDVSEEGDLGQRPDGVIVWAKHVADGLRDDVKKYFESRDEDSTEFLKEVAERQRVAAGGGKGVVANQKKEKKDKKKKKQRPYRIGILPEDDSSSSSSSDNDYGHDFPDSNNDPSSDDAQRNGIGMIGGAIGGAIPWIPDHGSHHHHHDHHHHQPYLGDHITAGNGTDWKDHSHHGDHSGTSNWTAVAAATDMGYTTSFPSLYAGGA